ncbi:ATP-binding protein [Massilia sp. TS11]|uniref:ATP-binding protein n=1 Tax=Massilia sp. TS11 TaxID=2908003 RepID=UPI001EDA7BA8|nr:ATP-binding protein [Massilia sp. TS11]MCG2586310.1 ATP-binding protein [Massilia sp. TS11]
MFSPWQVFERPQRSLPVALSLWAAGWAVLAVLDAQLDLANKALILVLVAACAAIWLSPRASLLVSTLAVLAFNFSFVPPRGTFAVDLRQHAFLLLTLLAVSWTVALMMARQRELAAREHRHAEQAEQLRQFGERLREADDPRQLAAYLQQLLAELTGGPASLLFLAPQEQLVGAASTDERAGLRICARNHQAMGPGTGRHDEQPAWYLPLRGRSTNLGAAIARMPDPIGAREDNRLHAQALCDQLGLALERAAAIDHAQHARAAAQLQGLRNTMLAAIAHDHRTPLATILGAATALHDQDDRLAPEQRLRLAATIADEAGQLIRLTENTLQLARLDAPGLQLRTDWESAEDLVGSVLQRLRQRQPPLSLRARIAPGLPLLRCDAILIVQLLDNLVDNALKYGGPPEAIELLVDTDGDQLLLAVRDRGPGVPSTEREAIFAPFQRADHQSGRGAGVGLALCRAIARVHGGELRLRMRRHGGSAFEVRLPLPPQPAPGGDA